MAQHDPQQKIDQYFFNSQWEDYDDACARLGKRTESEIERLLQRALIAITWRREDDFGAAVSLLNSDKVIASPPWDGHRVFFNVPLGPYRPDILIHTVADGGARELVTVVECDGHDFHERTKEQAAHDKQRDRWMTAQGIRVFRFTGSEVFRDPIKCAEEVMEAVDAFLCSRAA